MPQQSKYSDDTQSKKSNGFGASGKLKNSDYPIGEQRSLMTSKSSKINQINTNNKNPYSQIPLINQKKKRIPN